MYKFHEGKINIQQVSQTKKLLCNIFPEKKSACSKFLEDISFMKRKIYVRVSRREKSSRNKFQVQK